MTSGYWLSSSRRCSPGGCGRAARQNFCSPSWSRPGLRKPRPPSCPNASASPTRCTTCLPTRCPAWCSTWREPGCSQAKAARTRRSATRSTGPTGWPRPGWQRPGAPSACSATTLPGPERLAGLATEFEGESGVACKVAMTGDSERDLGTDGRLTLYRVAQEALTNIRKHARPGRVEIRLTYEPAGTRLTIEDFDTYRKLPALCDGTGYGLTGMRERAELLGGTLTAGLTDGGFQVQLWVPA